MGDEALIQDGNPDIDDVRDTAKAVEERAAELLQEEERKPLDPRFVKGCLDNNERGDGCMAASLFKDRYMLNVTKQTREPEWYAWNDNVWKIDVKKSAYNAVEECAHEYACRAMELSDEIECKEIDKKDPVNGWKVKLRDKYQSRIDKLRTREGMGKTITMSAIVDPKNMACEESDFNNRPWLLPVANCVIDLKSGAITRGNPADRMTKALDIEYDPRAEYGPFVDFIREISGSEEMEQFQKRSFGYAATGFSHEQYIWIYLGPGRNGKGILFNLIGDVLGPYYHEIARSMIIEQKNEPSPNAASEHKYSLLHKRMIVAAETNKNQRWDLSAVKALTGQNRITCRPLFSSEVEFFPSFATFLQTNNLSTGLTREFSMMERLLIIEFLYMYVDNPDEYKRKFPAQADKFRKKDPKLYERLSKYRPGILRWIVEGCLEWQRIGLQPPKQVLDRVAKLAKEEDYLGRFIDDCLDFWPDKPEIRTNMTALMETFKFWWGENSDPLEKNIPHTKTVTKQLREKGYSVEPSGGKTWVYKLSIKFEVAGNMRGEK